MKIRSREWCVETDEDSYVWSREGAEEQSESDIGGRGDGGEDDQHDSDVEGAEFQGQPPENLMTFLGIPDGCVNEVKELIAHNEGSKSESGGRTMNIESQKSDEVGNNKLDACMDKLRLETTHVSNFVADGPSGCVAQCSFSQNSGQEMKIGKLGGSLPAIFRGI